MSTIQIQLPDSVLEQARKLAETDEIPLDQFVALAVAERVSALQGLAYLQQRARQGDLDKFLSVLGKAPAVEPGPTDRID